MGRFLSLAVVLLCACGDNSVSDVGPSGKGPDDTVGATNTDGTSPRYVPAVCGSQTWTTATVDRAVDMAVLGSPQGATVLAVPQAGGDPMGFVLDSRMRMMAGEQKVPLTTEVSEVALAPLGDRMAVTGIAGGSVLVHVLDSDLRNPQLITKLPALTISKPAFFNTQADRVMAAGTESGLTLYRFADSGEPIDSLNLGPAKPVRSMASTQLGVSLVTAWSTDGECFMTKNAAFAPGPIAHQNAPCPSPSIAINDKTGAGAMVFESAEGVRIMFTQGTQMGGDARLLRPDSTAPRALFDGTNMWLSYLDARGDVVVGFLDQDRNLVSMSLNGPKPYDSAYQLAMVQGQPWVFALDDAGYTGHRLCVDAQW